MVDTNAQPEVPVSANRRPRAPEEIDLKREWFRWWRGALESDEDPRFRRTWERACNLTTRMVLARSAAWAGIGPLLQDLLFYLQDLTVEQEVVKLEDRRCRHCGMPLDEPLDEPPETQ